MGDLGVTVGELVADGQGQIETQSLFLNAFYDFENSTNFTPFLGGGIGYSNIDVEYKPSNIEIINDDDDVFSYQVSGGVSYAINDQFHIVGSVNYRGSDDPKLNSSLLPAELEVENESLCGVPGVPGTVYRIHFSHLRLTKLCPISNSAW